MYHFTFKTKNMKKIFTLVLAIGFVTLASAQGNKAIIRNNSNQKQVVQNMNLRVDSRPGQVNYNSSSFSQQQKQAEISRINQEYDRKIAIIQRSPSARSSAMRRKVSELEKERTAAVRQVGLRYQKNADNSFHAIVKTNQKKW